MGYFIGCLIGYIIVWSIFGMISKHINESKGYDGGFAWGFWLGIIGIIVVACRADNRSSYISSQGSGTSLGDNSSVVSSPNRLAGPNEWKCHFCGRINQDYVTTCLCGHGKGERLPAPAPKSDLSISSAKSSANDIMSELKKYKEMLDAGLITEEDYENKKKELMK